MKKAFSIVAFLLLSSQASAKTQGHYIGIDVLQNSVEVSTKSSVTSDNNDPSIAPFYNFKKDESDYGLGINYKYAFNFNDFFIAPAISYNILNSEVKTGNFVSNNDYTEQRLKIKNSATLKVDFGYDITDKLAFYIPLGYSIFYYDLATTDISQLGGDVRTTKSNKEGAAFIGVGLSFEIFEKLILNLEYNKYEELNIKTSSFTSEGTRILYDTDIEILKLGASYKF